MHYCVIFFYPRRPDNGYFGHVDLLVFNDQGCFKFNWHDAKKPFETRNYTIYDKFTLPSNCCKALVLKVESSNYKITWWDHLFKTCSELTRFIGKLDTGFCITPRQLYKKLIKYNTKRNFTILQEVNNNVKRRTTRR